MKQVIVVNESLKLPRGKLSAQVAHASMASFLTADENLQRLWLNEGMPKIVLSASNEEEILKFHQAARDIGLSAQVIKDAGRTVVASGTITCVGIGPAKADAINKITRALKLID